MKRFKLITRESGHFFKRGNIYLLDIVIVTFLAMTFLGNLIKAADKRVVIPPAEALPLVPEGFEISVFAGEPFIYKPSALCFDAKGRVMVGQGPQYHLSKDIEQPDSVVLLTDTDGDGVADRRKVFATGFNSIQALAWKGGDLYVANSPELTVVRDLDGDDVADEYVVVFTDLGNAEHSLHGLVWGPDGRLYMSKGNSKGHNQPEKYGRVAPKAFRELWDVAHPPGAPDIPEPEAFTAETYKKGYHHFADDWGRQGGVLRYDPVGPDLEIVSRGLRNPWDIAMDDEFNWLGTDNDQTQGDRIIMPFYGAHFGWGHSYSSHWTGEGNLPTVPVSGPMTSGSWAGIIHCNHGGFPSKYRDVFFINDWMLGTYVYRPRWKGALLTSREGALEPFIQRSKEGMIYRPTDIAIGPKGAIYTLGWGGNYHYEPGKEGAWVFRISHSEGEQTGESVPLASLALSEFSVRQLVMRLGSDTLPARRVNAQDELVRRGAAAREELLAKISKPDLNTGQQTWAVWALGRMEGGKAESMTFQNWTDPAQHFSRNLRLQGLRILGWRAKRFGEKEALLAVVKGAVVDADPRVRFEAIQAVQQAGLGNVTGDIIEQLSLEEDRLVFYVGWQALRSLLSVDQRREWLDHKSARVRLAILLSLQEDYAITQEEVLALVDRESDSTIQSWALTFALNPLPPAKFSDEPARVEMEQTVSISMLIERAREAKTPELRRLYLQMMSRASVRAGAQQAALLDFYRSLKTQDERMLLLPVAATTLKALPDLWQAFGGGEPLQNAAVAGIRNLVKLRSVQLPPGEEEVQASSRSLFSVGSYANEIAGQILEKIAEVEPKDKKIKGALRALDNLPVSESWTVDENSFKALLRVLEVRKEPVIRSLVLRQIEKMKLVDESEIKNVSAVLRILCGAPDAHLYRDLLAVVTRFELKIEVPAPTVATASEILSRLGQANAKRGKELFFDPVRGAGCAVCHRVQGQGSEFAPDLSAVGIRLTPENIVQAILEPSAAITEGYGLHQIETTSGSHLGAVLLETPTEMVMVTPAGQRLTIEVASVISRKKIDQSVMPQIYGLFGDQALADLTAYLKSLRN